MLVMSRQTRRKELLNLLLLLLCSLSPSLFFFFFLGLAFSILSLLSTLPRPLSLLLSLFRGSDPLSLEYSLMLLVLEDSDEMQETLPAAQLLLLLQLHRPSASSKGGHAEKLTNRLRNIHTYMQMQGELSRHFVSYLCTCLGASL